MRPSFPPVARCHKLVASLAGCEAIQQGQVCHPIPRRVKVARRHCTRSARSARPREPVFNFLAEEIAAVLMFCDRLNRGISTMALSCWHVDCSHELAE